jgi:2-hydroxychromene-2-carboxylate isomerase
MKTIDFYYFFGSVYAYLSVMRMRPLAAEAGVSVRWRPINVRPLMKENNVALRSEAAKVKYMQRDFERRAALHGLACGGWPAWPTDPDLTHNLAISSARWRRSRAGARPSPLRASMRG